MNCPQSDESRHSEASPTELPMLRPEEPGAEVDPALAAGSAWRDELSDRLSRYRARRKMPPPRYPSLNLRFDSSEIRSAAGNGSGRRPTAFASVSDQALALDTMADFSPEAADQVSSEQPAGAAIAAGTVDARKTATANFATAKAPTAKVATAKSSTAKIIEFPRLAWGPPAPPPDQLAEPVIDRLRILEVPEVAPPLPALGGITIEPAKGSDPEKRAGIDFPVQRAALARRISAGLVDGVVVAAASALFGFIFWKVTEVRPPLAQILGLAAGIPCLFWAAYQYLLVVYAGRTVGLHVAGLELALFDGTSTCRRLRRWRVLASFLSAASLGMGFAWAFLDEASLCWHDRITRTCVAPKTSRGRK